ncbi:hypothetical protein HDV00_010965 [Rhizophlyctis rosea]|nr:hypothetical protein HDV00_010965 [Rhizophlyctis rosea]
MLKAEALPPTSERSGQNVVSEKVTETLYVGSDNEVAGSVWDTYVRASEGGAVNGYSREDFRRVLNGLLRTSSRLSDGGMAQRVLDDMIEAGLPPDIRDLLLAMELQHLCRNFEAVRGTFHLMQEFKERVPVRAYELMVDVEGRVRNGDACEELIRQMEANNVTPNMEFWVTAAKAFVRSDCLSALERICTNLENSHSDQLHDIYLDLLLFCTRALKIPETMVIYGRMAIRGISPQLTDLNRILHMFGKSGDAAAVAMVWESMEELGITPNITTYDTLGYIARGKSLDVAWKHMKRGGLMIGKSRLRALAERMYILAEREHRVDDTLKCYDMCQDLGVEIPQDREYSLARRIAHGGLAYPSQVYRNYTENDTLPHPKMRRPLFTALYKNGNVDMAMECFLTIDKVQLAPHPNVCRNFLRDLAMDGRWGDFAKFWDHLVGMGVVLHTDGSNLLIETLRRSLGAVLQNSAESERLGWSVFRTMRRWGSSEHPEAAPDDRTYELLFSNRREVLDPSALVEVLAELDAESVKKHLRLPAYITVIDAYIATSKPESAQEWVDMCFRAYPDAYLQPSVYSYLIDHHLKTENVTAATSLYTQMEKATISIPPHIPTAFVTYYLKRDQYVEAEKWEQRTTSQTTTMHETLKAYTTSIGAAARRGDLDTALSLFSELRQRGLTPDVWCYTALISACVAVRDIRAARTFFEQMKRQHIVPSDRTYEVLITGYARIGWMKSVDQCIGEMRKDGFKTSGATFHKSLVHAYAESDTGRMWEEFEKFSKFGKPPPDEFYQVLMAGYARKGDLDGCNKVMTLMHARNVRYTIRTWTAYMEACARSSDWVALGETWGRLIRKGPKPDAVSIGVAMKAITDTGGLQGIEVAKKFGERALRHDRSMVDVGCFNHIVEVYGRSLDVSGMRKAVEWMEAVGVGPNESTWCIIIECLYRSGDGRLAVDIFDALVGWSKEPSLRLKKSGWKVQPVKTIQNAPPAAVALVFDACGYCNLLPEAHRIWKKLGNARYPLNHNHLTSYAECMIRSGRPEQAVELIAKAEKPGSGLPRPEVKTFVNILGMLTARGKVEEAMAVRRILDARKGNWVDIVNARRHGMITKLWQEYKTKKAEEQQRPLGGRDRS